MKNFNQEQAKHDITGSKHLIFTKQELANLIKNLTDLLLQGDEGKIDLFIEDGEHGEFYRFETKPLDQHDNQ